MPVRGNLSTMRSGSNRLGSWRVLLALSVLLTAGTAAIATSTHDDETSEGVRMEYVALGDSYTSAPYVPPQTPGDPCLKSGANYPHILAEELPALDLTDASCGGATTTNMTEPQTLGTFRIPAQFDALSPDTELVTIGIGANDFSVFSQLIYACFPGVRTGNICHDASPRGVALDKIVGGVQSNVRRVLEEIQTRSPRARVIVIPYPQLISAVASCPDLIPFGPADSAYIADVNRRISQALVDAATEAGVEYVDVLAASAGHDICADEPWVMGSNTDVTVAASFHPLAAEQRAVAGLLRERLCDGFLECG